MAGRHAHHCSLGKGRFCAVWMVRLSVEVQTERRAPSPSGRRVSSAAGSSTAYISPLALMLESPPSSSRTLYSDCPWRVRKILRMDGWPALHTCSGCGGGAEQGGATRWASTRPAAIRQPPSAEDTRARK